VRAKVFFIDVAGGDQGRRVTRKMARLIITRSSGYDVKWWWG
jgi:hypothetical protein